VTFSRLMLRLLPDLRALRQRREQRRVLVVGAGRAGRSLVREFREDPTARVVGFLDDNMALRRRRIQGVTVLGATDEIGTVLVTTRPDEVLVSIPNAPGDRLDGVVQACAAAEVPCRFVRRRTETQTPLLEVAAE
jgi:FlaA1/EpsC-like NDP-sugar epimerase